jgi:branched-chain amino acid transport system permease protein
VRRWQLGGLAALAAAGVAAPYVLPSYIVGLLTLIVIAALFAASINLLAEAGLISAGHAGISAAAGYGLAYAIVHGSAWPVALLVAAATTVVVAGIYALTSMRTATIYFLMVTLALGMLVFGLAYRLGRITGGENGLRGLDRPPAVAAYWQFYFLCLGVLAVALVALWVLSRSPFGLALRGIRDSESRMRSLGYNVAAHKFCAFMLSGMVAGVSGVLATYHAEFISPVSAGFARSALGVVMVILGGTGALLGPLAGAAVVVWAENVLSGYLDRWPTALGLLFIAVVLFVPEGLAGIASRIAGWLPGSRRTPPAHRGAGPGDTASSHPSDPGSDPRTGPGPSDGPRRVHVPAQPPDPDPH